MYCQDAYQVWLGKSLIPTGPRKGVQVEIAGLKNQHYLIVLVNAWSERPGLFPMRTVASSSTAVILREPLAQLGIPEMLITHNDWQFTSTWFARFCQSMEI